LHRRCREIAGAREAAAAAGSQIMIAVARPKEAYRRRKLQSFNLTAAAERIALALHDECGAVQMLEVSRAQRLRFSGRMKRVAEAHEADDLVLAIELIGHEAGDAPAHGFAADQELCRGPEPRAQCGDRIFEFVY